MENTKEKEILQKFKRSKEAKQFRHQKWNELVKFDEGEQWEGKIPPWIPKPVTNWIHTVKVTKRAAFSIENPLGELIPLSTEDIVAIGDLQRVYEYEWHRMKATKYMRQAIESGKLLGNGILHFYWDENTGVGGGTGTRREGEIKIREVDPAEFYPDPTAFTLEDCQFVHLVQRKNVDWLKKHPLFAEKMKEVEARRRAKEERGEIYDREHDATEASQRGIIDFHTHYEKIPNDPDVGGFKYKVTYLAGDEIIHEIEELEPNCYPFAIYHDFRKRQSFWSMGTCELILENQKVINKVESIISLIGTQLQNPQRVVNKRSGINPREVAKYGSAPGHVFVSNTDPTRALHWANPPAIPQSLFQLMEQAKENIREVTGITQSYQGESVGSLQTSRGVEQLIERATMRDRDQMKEVEEFVEQMTRLIVKFVTTKHDEVRYARRLDVDELDFTRYVGTDYKGLEYDFRIDVSAKTPMSRQRTQEVADRLLEVQGQYGYDPALIQPEEYIEISPFPKEVTDRLKQRMENERLVNNMESIKEVAMMITEAINSGLDPEEVDQMAMAMIEQREEQRKAGIGSAHSGQQQQQQAGV